MKNILGERWEDIPGFEGLYEISSFGRVKSLRRWRATGNGTGYYTREMIMQQYARRKKTHRINEYTYTVGCSLKRNGRSVTRSTARYVYCAFTGLFDLEDKTQIISYKDCNGRNIHYKNLFLTSRSDSVKRSHRLKRSRPNFLENAVPVRQLTMERKIIAEYASLKEAEEKTGIIFSAIAACVGGRIFQSHGFRWESPAKKMVDRRPEAGKSQYFNEYLWEVLGRPRTSKSKPIASLNLHPENMKGERWKPVEGLETAFQLSNFGRIKGLPRFKRGQVSVWTKGMIKRLIPDRKAHKQPSCLLIGLTKNGINYQQSAARLVYHHFVKKIDLSDKSIRVGYKNGKCFDLHWKNLVIQ